MEKATRVGENIPRTKTVRGSKTTAVDIRTVWYACLNIPFQDWPSVPVHRSVSARAFLEALVQIIHWYVLIAVVSECI